MPWGEHKRNGRAFALKDVKLLVPTVPSNFFCVGINYADHIRKMAAKRKTEPVFPEKPDIGYRSNNALIAHEENIVKPADAGEAIPVRGRAGRRVRQALPQRHARDRARLRVRLDHRQRRLRAHLAEDRPHAVARPRIPTPSSRWGRGSSPASTRTT